MSFFDWFKQSLSHCLKGEGYKIYSSDEDDSNGNGYQPHMREDASYPRGKGKAPTMIDRLEDSKLSELKALLYNDNLSDFGKRRLIGELERARSEEERLTAICVGKEPEEPTPDNPPNLLKDAIRRIVRQEIRDMRMTKSDGLNESEWRPAEHVYWPGE